MILKDDPITAEIRAIRHCISAAYDHDLTKLLTHYQQLEQEWAKHGKSEFLARHYVVQPTSTTIDHSTK